MVCPEMFLIEKVMLLLIVSFFVLVGVTKTDSKNLKTFGRLLAMTLWIIAIFATVCLTCPQCLGKYPKMGGHFHKSGMMKCH